jgi:hypothetical protein
MLAWVAGIGQGAAVVVAGLTPVLGGSMWAAVLALVGLVILTIAKRRMRSE